MARIHYIKARKEYICSKCRSAIKAGDMYYKGTPFHQSPVLRCTSCGLQSWELSSSEYVQQLGALQSNWQKTYGLYEDVWNDIRDELENIKDGCEERFDNIPEQLQDGDAGTLLQERMDVLDDAMNELDCIDFDDILTESYDNLDEDYAKKIDELVGEDKTLSEMYSELTEKHSDDDAVEQLVANVESEIDDRVSEILGELEC